MSFLNSLTQFAQGIDPTVTRLMLGEFELMEFEVPERMVIAGRQKTVQHQLIGGRRIIDVLGTLGKLLAYTQLVRIAYGASPLVTNVTFLRLNGGSADLAASPRQLIRPGTLVVS